METQNYIALISDNIDVLGRNFTQVTYGVFAANLTPIATSLFVLYVIFLGFSLWRGHGEANLMGFVFRLIRIAVIYFLATGWGWAQTYLYLGVTQAPVEISSVMLQNITPEGRGMSENTIERDLFDFYQIAVMASIRIAQQASISPDNNSSQQQPSSPNQPQPQPQQQSDQQQQQPDAAALAQNPFLWLLNTMPQSLLIWLSAVLFVGGAVFIIFFTKIALLVLLALGPFFILLLMFHAPSRFFVGWVTALVQMILAPIFLYVFLAFYLQSIKGIVIDLKMSLNLGGVPAMKDGAPFVLICFAGVFLLFQIFPLAGRLAASVPQLAVTAMNASSVQQRFAAWRTSAKGPVSSSPVRPSAHPAAASPSETIVRDLQEQKAALTRLGRNR